MSAGRLKVLALTGLLLAVTLGAAGCRAALTAPPAIFSPRPVPSCSPDGHGGTLCAGTLTPGQPLPALPSAPAATLDAYGGP